MQATDRSGGPPLAESCARRHLHRAWAWPLVLTFIAVVLLPGVATAMPKLRYDRSSNQILGSLPQGEAFVLEGRAGPGEVVIEIHYRRSQGGRCRKSAVPARGGALSCPRLESQSGGRGCQRWVRRNSADTAFRVLIPRLCASQSDYCFRPVVFHRLSAKERRSAAVRLTESFHRLANSSHRCGKKLRQSSEGHLAELERRFHAKELRGYWNRAAKREVSAGDLSLRLRKRLRAYARKHQRMAGESCRRRGGLRVAIARLQAERRRLAAALGRVTKSGGSGSSAAGPRFVQAGTVAAALSLARRAVAFSSEQWTSRSTKGTKALRRRFAEPFRAAAIEVRGTATLPSKLRAGLSAAFLRVHRSLGKIIDLLDEAAVAQRSLRRLRRGIADEFKVFLKEVRSPPTTIEATRLTPKQMLSYYVTTDVGVAVFGMFRPGGLKYGQVLPYFAIHFYFVPVNKDVSLRYEGGWGRRLSVFGGLNLVNYEFKSDELGTSGIFGNTVVMGGIGLRLTDYLRASAGLYLFRRTDPNPLNTDNTGRLNLGWFFAASVDLATFQTIEGIWTKFKSRAGKTD